MELEYSSLAAKLIHIDWPDDRHNLAAYLVQLFRDYAGTMNLEFHGALTNPRRFEAFIPAQDLPGLFEYLNNNCGSSPLCCQLTISNFETRASFIENDDLLHLSSQVSSSPKKTLFRASGSPVYLENGYYNRGLFLILNGRSFQGVDRESLQAPGLVTMTVNNGGHKFRSNLWCAVDEPYRFMKSIWSDPKVLKLVPAAYSDLSLGDRDPSPGPSTVAECANTFFFRRTNRFIPHAWLHESAVCWGEGSSFGGCKSVMLAALKLAYYLGFRRVYLLGCDFQMSPVQGYWFDETRTAQAIQNNEAAYHALDYIFHQLRPHFNTAGFEVYNVNPTSKLSVFPFLPLEEAIAGERITLNMPTLGMYHESHS